MTSTADAPGNSAASHPPIICFSHLGWDVKLYQRPQQILSRLAQLGHPVYYFACVGYHRHSASPMAGVVNGVPGVQVYTLPYAPGIKRLAGLRRWLAVLKVASVLSRHRVRKPVLWFYHPQLFPLGYAHADSAIVYDVMDHFPSFEQSDDELYYEELTVLAEADIAFTGGRSLDRHIRSMVHALYSDIEVKRNGREPASTLCDIHCFPSGVDLPHFRTALSAHDYHPAVKDLPRPVFGYFGAIDERLDWALISQLAAATSGSIMLAGPLLQSPPDLPANVHLPGGLPYTELPQLLAGFDVALIPFRDSPLVSYISPTKTPEYLAGGKPVVSTPIPDVVTDYGDIVHVAPAGSQFVERAIAAAETPPAAAHLAAEAEARAMTWDNIAKEMHGLVMDKIAEANKTTHAAR